MSHLHALVKNWWLDETGVTSIEYVLMGSLIALVIIVSVSAVGFQLCQSYKGIAEEVAKAIGSTATVACG